MCIVTYDKKIFPFYLDYSSKWKTNKYFLIIVFIKVLAKKSTKKKSINKRPNYT